MKVLIIGSAGQVGQSVVRRAVARGDSVIATYKSRPPHDTGAVAEPLDKADPAQCSKVIGHHRPDVVVDTGAMHNVDYCETHPDEAFAVNREGTRHLAEAARSVGARFAFVSTDFVFDGQKPEPYVEVDPPAPQSLYAQSKLAGEEAAFAACPATVVVRPSVIYSWLDSRFRATSSSGKGMNFGTWAVEEVAHGRPVRIVADQVASPTLADDLGGAILALVDRQQEGVFHAAGSTATNRFEFTVQLVQRLGLDGSLVQPVRTAELHQKAPRPLNSSLDSTKLARATGYRTLTLPEALDRFARSFAEDPATAASRT